MAGDSCLGHGRGAAMRLVSVGLAMIVVALAAQPGIARETADSTRVRQEPREVIALVPTISAHPYHLEPGTRPFAHRLAVSPAYGFFGSEPLFALRASYQPDSWLGYEASLGHNPGQSVHAALHSFNLILRRPFAGRTQPYVTAGYGMVVVFPGQAVNAKPVTKNALSAGGGVEWFLRDDLAIRGDLRHATVFGQQRDREGLVTFGYLQGTVGFSFHRTIQP